MRTLIPHGRKAFFLVTATAAAVLLAACAHDAIDDAAWQASRYGTAAGDAHGGRDNSGLEMASRITEKFYWVAKYEATLEQRKVAESTARKMVAERAKSGVKKHARYLAVRTRSDSRAKTKTSVMIWDTQSQQIVGNDVYDLNDTPPAQTVVKFETYVTEYVGGTAGL